MTDREELLAVMAAARADVDAIAAACTADDWLENLGDGWRRKDAFDHIAVWDRMAVYNINRTPFPEADEVLAGREWDIDYFNQTMRARHWDREVDEILEEVQAAYQAVVAAVEQADEAELAPGARVFEVIDVDSAGHYRAHLPIPDRMKNRWPDHTYTRSSPSLTME